jgi:hypothetical protein
VKYLRLAVLILAFTLAAEIGARFDDVFFHNGRLLGTPSQDDLWIHDKGGRHGIPHASFGQVRLNSYGLWGPEPKAGPCERVLFIGGSETFGIPEVKDGAYTEIFRREWKAPGCTDSFNGAIAGMTIYTALSYYRDWASKISPTRVVVYPSTHFYLSNDAPGSKAASTPQTGANDGRNGNFGLINQSRMFSRLRNVLTLPGFIQKFRQRRWIAAEMEGRPSGWIYEQVPEDRLVLLREHLLALIMEVRRSGAEPVLVTHAVSASRPPVTADDAHTESMRVWMPRATKTVIAEFPYRSNEVIRDVGRQEGVSVIDAAAELAGQRKYFVDLVHLSASGREAMGKLLARSLSTSH